MVQLMTLNQRDDHIALVSTFALFLKSSLDSMIGVCESVKISWSVRSGNGWRMHLFLSLYRSTSVLLAPTRLVWYKRPTRSILEPGKAAITCYHAFTKWGSPSHESFPRLSLFKRCVWGSQLVLISV